MMYILAVLLPPLALLLTGKIFQAIFNAALFIVGLVFLILGGWLLWLLCVLHAVFVVHGDRADRRTQKIVDAIKDKD